MRTEKKSYNNLHTYNSGRVKGVYSMLVTIHVKLALGLSYKNIHRKSRIKWCEHCRYLPNILFG